MPGEIKRKDEDFHAKVIQKTSELYCSKHKRCVSERSRRLQPNLELTAQKEFRFKKPQNNQHIVEE